MSEIVTGDTAWIMLCTAMVMLMTPGLALFYGGMVRRKNIISMLSLCFVSIALVSLQWVLIGYTLAFGSDTGGFVGGMDYLLFKDVGQEASSLAGNIPHIVFSIFQMMFAIITIAIIASAFAERVKFISWILFVILWSTLVYAPVAHWVWGGGFIGEMGALDFAGGTVVHISSGFSALAVALVIGKRKGYGEYSINPHDLPMTALGTALLWFGWFGFNAGSALAADGLAANAFLVTNTAAATAALTWMIVSWYHDGKPSLLGLLSGAVAGLVVITPAAGFVDVTSAIIMGFVVGVVCYFAVLFRSRAQIDESLDAFAIHGVGGTLGALLTGVFASAAVNSGIDGGLLTGNVNQFVVQAISVVAVVLYAFIATLVMVKLLDVVVGLKVSEREEYLGLDISQHKEIAYS